MGGGLRFLAPIAIADFLARLEAVAGAMIVFTRKCPSWIGSRDESAPPPMACEVRFGSRDDSAQALVRHRNLLTDE